MKPVLCITLNPAIDMTISLEMLTLGAVNRATTSQMNAAGKGLNVAQVLADLGMDVYASGFLGADNTGIFERLFDERDTLAHSENIGAIHNHFIKVAGITRTNIKLADLPHDGGRTTDVNGKGFMVTETDKVTFFEKIGELAKASEAVVVAGSLASGFDLMDFSHLIDTLTQAHQKVCVDVSGEALKIALTYPLWLIKPNSDELFEALGQRAETLDEQLALLREHQLIANVLISMGDKGVRWFKYDSQEIYQATPPTVTIASTVGAGDTLVAGMVFGLLHQHTPLVTLTRATALSAYTVSIIGVKAPPNDTLRALMNDVTVEQFSMR